MYKIYKMYKTYVQDIWDVKDIYTRRMRKYKTEERYPSHILFRPVFFLVLLTHNSSATEKRFRSPLTSLTSNSSAVMHFWKMVNIFHKNYPKKPTVTLAPLDNALLMARLTIKLTELSKQRWGQSAKKRATKRVKWGNKESIQVSLVF